MTFQRTIRPARGVGRAGRSRTPRAVAIAAVALATWGCEDPEWAASFGSGGLIVGVGSQAASAVIGSWLNVAGTGTASGYTVETTWTFNSDGTARRSTVTRTALGDVVAVSETRATWQAGAGVLLIDLEGPSTQLLRVPYSISYGVDGTFLVLDGTLYSRVGS